jgi:hypothetical protein
MFQVMGESHTGKTLVLRKGFASEDDALDHPVRLVHWKRIWVEKSPPEEQPDNRSPPFPWNVLWVNGHTYVVDANGKKFAILLGTQARREHVAAILCEMSDNRKMQAGMETRP